MLQLWFIANTILWPFAVNVGGSNILLSEIVLILAGGLWLAMNRHISVGSVKAALLFLAYFVFSFVLAVTGPCTDEFSKSIVTALMLAFLILLGWETGRRATPGDWESLQNAATWSLAVAFVSFFIEFLRPSWFPAHSGAQFGSKLSGFFSEPSHVGFSLFPCIAILMTAQSSKMRRRGVLALVALLIASRSSTLILLLAAWVLYRLLIQRKLRQASLLILGAGFLIAVGSAINYDKLVVGISESNDLEAANASSLVYLQGWEDMWSDVVRTRGLGLGFNMMGCNPLPDVPARDLLVIETGHADLNAEDGSALFIKVVSEAGVFGIAFYIALIWWWFRLERRLLLHGDDPGYPAAAQAALIFCFVAASFIRSTGYFAGTFPLLIIAVSGACTWQQSLLKKPQDHTLPEQA